MKTVPNQRTITVSKAKTDKQHRYTANNLEALDEAAHRLQSKGGFKLYMYLAKNQDNYSFALSSAAFCLWSGLGIAAYNTAFEELKEQGYLVAKDSSGKETRFVFYDKSQLQNKEEEVIIEIPEEKVKETRAIEKKINKEFVF